MEVHAHTHTARKRWTHYLWEFLMLFLAVFCGFLAENYREHQVEHRREKQFMLSFTNDLQRDIFWLDTVIRSAKARIANLDSFLITMIQVKKDEIPVPAYQQLRKSTTQIMFFSNNGTMTQLKNSGGMRLIRNKDVIDSIEEYDRYMRRLEVRRDITDVLAHDLTITLNKTVQGKDVVQTIYDTTVLERSLALQTIRLNGQYVNELINQCITLRSRAAGDTTAFTFTRRGASRLINFIRDKYHLSADRRTPLEK